MPVGSTTVPFSSRISLRARGGADQADVVRRDDDGSAEPVERGEQVQQPLRHLGIDIAGRLVGDQQLRAG